MSEFRMDAKIADIKEIYDTFFEYMIELVISIRTTNIGEYVNTKTKSTIVVN